MLVARDSRRFRYCQSKPQPAYAPRFDVAEAAALVGYSPEDTFPEGTDLVLNDVQYISNPALFDRVPLPSKRSGGTLPPKGAPAPTELL